MAEGPPAPIRAKGATTWERLHEMCVAMTLRWEALPEPVRRGYAFPNPEDRRQCR